MLKIEYLHLHALFSETRRHLEDTGRVPEGAFDAYEEYDVGPHAIHRHKEDHHEALTRLIDGVVATIAARSDTPEDVEITTTDADTKLTSRQ